METADRPSDLVQSTPHMLILTSRMLEPGHGCGNGVWLAQMSKGVFQVDAGSLFPAFRGLERDDRMTGEWRATENNRRANSCTLRTAGHARLGREPRDWTLRMTAAAIIFGDSRGEF